MGDAAQSTRRVPVTGSVAVERRGSTVRVEIACDDPEAAEAIRQGIVAGARRGEFTLNLKTEARAYEH